MGNALTRYTAFFNISGEPALSVPLGLHSSGLPMAVQIIGRPFDEVTMFRAGHALEGQLERLTTPPPEGL